jgi:replicative DNA helicase
LRALSVLGQIEGQTLAAGGPFTGALLRRVQEAAATLKAAPLLVDDARGLTVAQLRARCRRELARQGVGLVIVDYLQLLSCPDQENATQEVTEISKQLKALAGELEVPIIVLSQLNRQSENREDRRPRLADLRQSGAIEQDADLVLLLHREDHAHRTEPSWHAAPANQDKIGVAEIDVAKNRTGRTGLVHLRFDGAITTFTDYPGPGGETP